MIRSLKLYTHKRLMKYPKLMWMKLWLKYHIRLRNNLKRQLNDNVHYNADRRIQNNILIPQIETSHYQMFQMFILAKALQLRGANVRLLLCDEILSGCEIKSKRTEIRDSCLFCRFYRNKVVPLFGLESFKMSDYVQQHEKKALRQKADNIAENYPDRYIYKGIDIIPMTNDSVVRYYYGAVTDDQCELKDIRAQHLLTAMMSIDVCERIDGSYRPNIILNNMFVYSVTEPYDKYFRSKKNVHVHSISISSANYHCVMMDIMDVYRSPNRFLKYANSRESKDLAESELAVLDKLIGDRCDGNISMFKDYGYFGQTANIADILKMNKDKRNLFLFSNVYWDVGMSECGQLFKSVIEWVIETIGIVRHKKDVHLYIKPHPAEVFESSPSAKGVVDYIAEKYPVLPDNVTIIHPHLKINTYELFKYVNLGLVFNSTLGIEMVLDKIPIVIVGKAPYGGIGFGGEPQTIEEYKKMLFGETAPIMPPSETARLFAYFYMVKTLIPWGLTKRVYADDFRGYTFDSLEDIMPGRNKHLDHLCDCILNPENKVIEGW